MILKLTAVLICLSSMTAASRVGMAQSVAELTDGSPVGELGGDRWSSRVFKVSVPAGQTRLTITTRGIAGGREAGVTLYAKQGAMPTTADNDARSGLVGNNERISIDNPTVGDWYILLYATTAYGGVTLSADFDDEPLPKTPPPVLELASVFSDHMVLQRNLPVPVWGTAKPGDTVTVEVVPQSAAPINAAVSKSTRAAANGKWRVDLAPQKASAQPMSMRVTSATGDPERIITDVPVGEVWLASGQSNMEWPLYKCTDGATAKAGADDSQLRLLTIPAGKSKASSGIGENPTPEMR